MIWSVGSRRATKEVSKSHVWENIIFPAQDSLKTKNEVDEISLQVSEKLLARLGL